MRFLVFKNTSGLGTASQLIVNWSSVKYIEPVDSGIFKMQLNNDSSIKFTMNVGNASDVIEAINTAVIGSPTNRIININPKSVGAFSFTSIEYLQGGNFINNDTTVYVSADGTDAENGQALLDGYQEAVAKIPQILSTGQYNSLGVFGSVGNVYEVFLSPGIGGLEMKTLTPYDFVVDLQNGAGALNYTFEITSVNAFQPSQRFFQKITLNGAPVTDAVYTSLQVPVLTVSKGAVRMVVGPGTYNLPSDLIINDVVSMVSLTGIETTIIKGSDVKIEAGANNVDAPGIYKGFEVQSNWYVATNLSLLTFEDIYVTAGTGSFQPNPGTGTASSVYKNCYAQEAFGSGNGNTSAGTFIECWGYKSFGYEADLCSGMYYRCGYDNSASSTSSQLPYRNGEYQFGYKCDQVTGHFYYCVGDYASFGTSDSVGTLFEISNNARFDNCIALGNNSFGSQIYTNKGKFANCIAHGQKSFSYGIPFGGVTADAEYVNCTAYSARCFGAPTGVGTEGAFEGRFINCTGLGTSNFGKYSAGPNVTTGLLYNCYSEDGFAAVSGSGKIRNSLDNSTFTIINLG